MTHQIDADERKGGMMANETLRTDSDRPARDAGQGGAAEMPAGLAARIIVPCVPDAILSPNRNAKWGYKDKRLARETLQTAAKYAALETARLGRIEGQVRVEACICWPAKRQRMDLDNLGAMLKGLWDGFTNAELWQDDRQMVSLTVTQDRLDRAGNGYYPGGCVVVDIEEVTR